LNFRKTITNQHLDLLLILIKRNLKRIERFSLWKSSCLNKAITAKILLNLLGVKCVLYFNILKSSDRLETAHASLLVEDCYDFLETKLNWSHKIFLI